MLSLFRSKAKKAIAQEAEDFRKFLFFCLYEVAAADGIDDDEREMMDEIIKDFGITRTDIKTLQEEVRSQRIRMPQTDESRRKVILLMVQMIIADGKITMPEVEIAMTIVDQMGYRPEVILEILDVVVAEVEQAELEQAQRVSNEFKSLVAQR